MRNVIRIATILAAAGACAPALAQDSTAAVGTTDALDALNAAQQRLTYANDLAPITSSLGWTWGILPIIKSSLEPGSGFSSNLTSANAISSDTLLVADTSLVGPAGYWNAPGAGINNTANSGVTPLQFPLGSLYQQAVGNSDFGGDSENLNGAVLNFTTSRPNRVYVERIFAGVNRAAPGQSTGGFGGLSVDAHGNYYFRADGFDAVTGTPDPLPNTGNGQSNWYRVDLLNRAAGNINLIDEVNTFDGGTATTRLVTNAPDAATFLAWAPPNLMPESVAGAPGAFVGVNDSDEIVRGFNGILAQDMTHFDAPNVDDHRGSTGQYNGVLLAPAGDAGGAIQTYGQLTQPPMGDTIGLNIFTMNGALNVVNTQAQLLPALVTDNDDGFALNTTLGEFNAYRSQTIFRGGVGMVGMGQDRAGNALAAATFYEFAIANDPFTHIPVARWDPANPGNVQWTLAAWVDSTAAGLSGKAIFDGAGNVIGQLVGLNNVTAGAPAGPSASTPAFDSAGNVWFIGAVEFFEEDDMGQPLPSDFDSALLRGVYDPDTFSYRLERVVELGNVAFGQNSGTPYQIQFIGPIADSNSASSGGNFSNSVNQAPFANGFGAAPSGPADTRNLGGVVLNAEIVYNTATGSDVTNPDGSVTFTFDEAEGDQSYQVLLYIAHYQCPGDLDASGDLSIFDVLTYLSLFDANDPAADWDDSNTALNIFDVLAYLATFDEGCPDAGADPFSF